MNAYAPVAQLDRALPSEGKGHTFESCRVRHTGTLTSARYCAADPPATIFSLSFWSTISTVRSMSAFGMPS
jgi:hypothetical protein